MNPEELSEYILKKLKAKGADDVVVSASFGKSHQIKFVNNEIAATNTWDSASTDIFLTKDKKIIFTTLKDITKDSADKTIEKIFTFAKHTQPKPDWLGIAEGPFKYKEIDGVFDKRIEKLEQKSIDFIKDAIDAASLQGGVRNSGVLAFGSSRDFLLTSNNVEAKDASTSISFSIRSFAEKNASGHAVSCARTLAKFEPAEAGKYAGKIAKMALNPSKCEPGKYDIIFDPLTFANFLTHVADSASIFSVEAGLSFFINKLNKSVASPLVNIYDDGYMPEGLSSEKFDDEGVPSQRNKIIENGVLKTYLHNTSTAKKYKTKTTASAGLVAPSPSNTVLTSGDRSKEELFEKIKKGLWVTNNWYTRFQNYETGDFSTIPRDGIFLIENGKIKRPVSDIRISDNMIRILQNIIAIAKESQQIYGWEVDTPVFTPAVLVKNVNVTKSTM